MTNPEITAIATTSLAVASFLVAAFSLWTQRSHNRRSVCPVAEILFGDYEGSLFIKLANSGVGPLTVVSVSVEDGVNKKGNVIDWMPGSIEYTDFVSVVSGRSIRPGSELVLLMLSERNNGDGFAERRDQCRAILNRLTIKVNYKDIYGKTRLSCCRPFRAERSCEWFGRNL